MEIGKTAEMFRRQKGMSQIEFSQKIGKSQAWISNLEKDKVTITPKILKELSTVLDVSPMDIILDKNTKISDNELNNIYKGIEKSI
jgi:transcriptional regulator with XRE-family HTH domain